MSACAARDGDADDAAPGEASQRLDKWLWFTRAVKSRTLAASLVTTGRVRLNSERVTKPSQQLKPGDVVTLTVHHRVRILRMLATGVRRGPPPEAKLLYEDLSPPPIDRSDDAPRGRSGPMPQREFGSGRPTKKDRRAIDRMRNDHDDQGD